MKKLLLLTSLLINLCIPISAYAHSVNITSEKTIRLNAITKNPEIIFEHRFFKNDLVKIQVLNNVITVYVGWKKMDCFAQNIYEKHYCQKEYLSITRKDPQHEGIHKGQDEIDIRHYHLLHKNKKQIETTDLVQLLKLLKQEQFLSEQEINQCLDNFKEFCQSFKNNLS